MAMQTKTHDVGVLGWWYGKNYGSILTYFGLHEAIASLGYSVLMVHEPLGYDAWRVKWPEGIVSMDFARSQGYDYTPQMHFSELPTLNDRVDTFVVGSDQLWNPRIGRVNDDLFLDFVSSDNMRIAYGTSFGNNAVEKFKPGFIAKQSPNLQEFDGISVREGYARDIANEIFGVKATKVIDPVFLLDRERYDALADAATVDFDGGHLTVFFLDNNPDKMRVAEAVADKLGLETIVVIPNPDGGAAVARELAVGERFHVVDKDAPENFLAAYRSGSYVVTDSFHGSAFSIIFDKPFSSIYNTKRGADRFRDFLGQLEFGDTRQVQVTDGPEEINANDNVRLDLDLGVAQSILAERSKASMEWLRSALAGEKSDDVVADWVLEAAEAAAETGGSDLNFVPASDAWTVTQLDDATLLSVAPGGSQRGNLVSLPLPDQLTKGAAYRLRIEWSVHTSAASVNLHVTDSVTGKFHVVGQVPGRAGGGTMRVDMIDFRAPAERCNEFMLGALHFTGPDAGAKVRSVTVEEIPVDEMKYFKKPKSHAERVKDLAEQDSQQFIAATTPGSAAQTRIGARTRIMYHAHAIEKGLSRSNFRPGFGNTAVPGLAKEMNRWIDAGRDTQDALFCAGASVLHAYFQRHREVDHDVSHFWKLLNDPAKEAVRTAAPHDGGILGAYVDREARPRGYPDMSFLDVVYGRRSVRDFSYKSVDDELIEAAVQIAMQAPSVCNRQAARVHQIDDPDQMQRALRQQGGYGGYGTPPKLLLVTCDLTAFLFAEERNQAYVDGGLFMMTLLLGIQQVGLGCVSLNTAMGKSKEQRIRKILDIPDNEVFIAFVAVGHYDPKVPTPRSKRLNLSEVLIRRDTPVRSRGQIMDTPLMATPLAANARRVVKESWREPRELATRVWNGALRVTGLRKHHSSQ